MPKPPRPAPVKFHEVQPGHPADFFVQLAEKTPKTTRDGKAFILCKFRDARRTASVAVWSDGRGFDECNEAWHVGDFYKIRGKLIEHDKYGFQIEIEQIRETNEQDKADGFSESLFVDRSRHDSETMFAELEALVGGEIKDEPLQKLVHGLLQKHAIRIKASPATIDKFFPFPGGWLEHTLSVTGSCTWLADKYAAAYPNVKFNRDLVIAGAVLHDLGRMLEMDTRMAGLPPEKNRPGQLLGQHFLAFAAVREAARDVADLNPELLELLEHLVISYLTIPKWGSPMLPAIPEALILHHADDLDAKFEMYARCLERDTTEGAFTSRDPILGRELLKDRRV